MKELSHDVRCWVATVTQEEPVVLDDAHCKMFPGMCYVNCVEYVMRYPEWEVVLGWVVWTGFVELEHHAVVRHRLTGELRDVTQRMDREKEVWFVLDGARSVQLEGQMVHGFHNVVYPRSSVESRSVRWLLQGSFGCDVVGNPVLDDAAKSVLDEMYSHLRLP